LKKTSIILLIILISTIPNIILAASTSATGEASGAQTATENTWTEMAPMLTPRSDIGVAVVDGKIYAIGGDDVGTNEMYDPVNNNWNTKASMPTPRSSFGTTVYQNKIYCLGGTGNVTGNEVYDPAANTWETKAPLPTARYIPETNVAGGKIYLMGGEPNQSLNEAYDPATDTWTTKTPIPNMATDPINKAADYSASAVVNGKIYWIGVTGFYETPKLGLRILTQLYDPAKDSWSLLASPPDTLPTQLPGAAVATIGVYAPQKIYMFGSGTHVVYDPATNQWSYTAKMPMPHGNFGLAVVNDVVFAIGGHYVFTICPLNLKYTPFGFGTVPPTISPVTPPNRTFTDKDILVFGANKPVVSMRYSLDGQDNTTFTGDLNLAKIPVGTHNITVYAVDAFGNVGSSETINFTVDAEPFPYMLAEIAVAACTLVALGVAALAIYFKKRKT
jgi:N-acetylneuraminic acid mutarotase